MPRAPGLKCLRLWLSRGREIKSFQPHKVQGFWRLTRRSFLPEPVSDAEADEYFASRPRGSQPCARVSNQSREIASRDELLAAVAAFEDKFRDKTVPRPPQGSGFRIVPMQIECWKNSRTAWTNGKSTRVTVANGSWLSSLRSKVPFPIIDGCGLFEPVPSFDLVNVAALHDLLQNTLVEQVFDVELPDFRITQSDYFLGGFEASASRRYKVSVHPTRTYSRFRPARGRA